MKRTFFAILVILFLLALLSASVFLVLQQTKIFGKAFFGTPGFKQSVEIKNSYLFASPLEASVESKEKIRVTVYILDGEGLGVAGKMVYLGENESLSIKKIQEVTDSLGRAIFDLSSNSSGVFFLEARVDQMVLPQKVRVSFR